MSELDLVRHRPHNSSCQLGSWNREAGEPTGSLQHKMSGSPELGCGEATRDPRDAGRPTVGCGAGGHALQSTHRRHTSMNLISLRQKTGRLALVTASTGFVVGLAFLNGGTAHSIGGLCNGRPASPPWLDASGQYGPALISGTDHDDVIVGSDGDDTIDAGD